MGWQTQTKKIFPAKLSFRINRSVTKTSLIRRFPTSSVLRLQRSWQENPNHDIFKWSLRERGPLPKFRTPRISNREKLLHFCRMQHYLIKLSPRCHPQRRRAPRECDNSETYQGSRPKSPIRPKILKKIQSNRHKWGRSHNKRSLSWIKTNNGKIRLLMQIDPHLREFGKSHLALEI